MAGRKRIPCSDHLAAGHPMELLMADLLEQLKAALADRYTIERELGSGGTLDEIL